MVQEAVVQVVKDLMRELLHEAALGCLVILLARRFFMLVVVQVEGQRVLRAWRADLAAVVKAVLQVPAPRMELMALAAAAVAAQLFRQVERVAMAL